MTMTLPFKLLVGTNVKVVTPQNVSQGFTFVQRRAWHHLQRKV